jgi:hypothetical protein
MEKLGSHWTDFHFDIFRKSVEKIVLLKSDKKVTGLDRVSLLDNHAAFCLNQSVILCMLSLFVLQR